MKFEFDQANKTLPEINISIAGNYLLVTRDKLDTKRNKDI